MININKFLRKYTTPAMWCGGVLIVLAMFFSKIYFRQTAANGCFIAAFLFCEIPILFRAIQGLRFRTISIEFLVSIAAIGACFIAEFSEAAIVTFLFQFGAYLEQKTMKKTRSAIKSLTQMAPTTAWRIKENEMEQIDADEVEEGDLLLVKPGGQIACDGIVVQGEGYVGEASITGEAVPSKKEIGDTVYSGTFLQSGTLQMKATKVGEDTTFARIIALVEEAQDAKSPMERFIDKFAKYYTPTVVLMAVLVLIFSKNPDTAITVLVLACPGALVIGAPIANVAGIGKGAREGILLKGGDSIHTFHKTDTIVFDKTGTLTLGRPQVQKEYCYVQDREQVLQYAASLERVSEQPLAHAVVEYAGKIHYKEAEDVHTQKGMGIEATMERHAVLIGNARWMEQNGIELPIKVREDLQTQQEKGASIVLISIDGKVSMLLAVSDTIKPDAEESIRQLKKQGIRHVVMLTGDNNATAQRTAKALGITEFQGELLPEEKLICIQKMQEKGQIVTFVGDGINDSPAIVAADTGIAMGSGTDVAIDSSDVVLIRSNLESLVRSLYLSKKTVRIFHQNIFIAVATVVLLLLGLFCGYIHMALGMLIHEASILVVVLNAMRLLGKNKVTGKAANSNKISKNYKEK